ncbi:Smooth isoform P [Fasciola hepatica]|uniref:Smooth isoform P n=1 Tax=Fasciola hepatica TaxID=6192 RepID=A0A4E0R8G6_FASHE|nr:Smooth isoform P [Fasciola hepatica]
MSPPNKKPRQVSQKDVEPSPVLHVRGLPQHTLEIDLLENFEQHGPVREIAMMPQKRQALVEFTDIEAAKAAVARAPHGKAMVEFTSVTEARQAKRHLNGADIYTGCCTLKVDFARPTKLTVTKNDKDSWDFEITAQSGWDTGVSNPSTTSASLLGRYDGNTYHVDPNNANDSLGYPSASSVQNRSLMCPSQFSGMVTTARSHTPVAMIYSMNMDSMNCDRLFNLVCLYGNVLRIKFLRSNEGTAMVQMGDPMAVDDLIDNLSGAVILGKQILIRPSKQTELLEVSQPYNLPDGSPSFKDYSHCRNNRYSTSALASKNRKFRPSQALHYWNCPPNFELSQMQSIFRDAGAPIPAKMVPYTKANVRTSSGVLQWNSEADALIALALCNHTTLANPEGGLPFIVKFSFASSVIRDFDMNTVKTDSSGGQLLTAVGGI